ncbi:MAG TPA: hypothetical protein VF631_06250 [Allosphingosinicella sp.]|jgi:hypothetical protein|uniref:hypothetical protein n=1 Tax=Allosphingosinicella sp. TaxID=2823234 RepID=UPI002F28D3EB
MVPRATLPALAALALAGTGTGIYLGKAAVAEINPIYYSEPEARFHSDLAPYRATEASGYQAGDLSVANLNQALGSGCIGCRTYPEEVILVHRGRADKYVPGGADVSVEPVAAVQVEQAHSPEFAAVERYATYPITQEAEIAPEAPVEIELAAAETETE